MWCDDNLAAKLKRGAFRKSIPEKKNWRAKGGVEGVESRKRFQYFLMFYSKNYSLSVGT